MCRILKEYVEGESRGEEYDTLIPSKIEVLGCRSYADCSYIETVRFTFEIGNERGGIPYPPAKNIVELDIATGYRPAEYVRADLKSLLSRFKIFQLERLLDAFDYRRYYCRI